MTIKLRTVSTARTESVLCKCINSAAKVFVVLHFLNWDVSGICVYYFLCVSCFIGWEEFAGKDSSEGRHRIFLFLMKLTKILKTGKHLSIAMKGGEAAVSCHKYVTAKKQKACGMVLKSVSHLVLNPYWAKEARHQIPGTPHQSISQRTPVPRVWGVHLSTAPEGSCLHLPWTLGLQISNCVQEGRNTPLSPTRHSRDEFRDTAAVTYQTKVQVRADPVKREQDAEGKRGKYINILQQGSNKTVVVNSM